MKLKTPAEKWMNRIRTGLNLGTARYVFVWEALAKHYELPYLQNRVQGIELARRWLDEHVPEWKTVQLMPKKDRWAQEQKRARKAANKRANAPKPKDVTSDDFLLSYEWRKLRMEVLVEQGATCQCCGAQASRDRVKMNVDHIKPRRLFPSLALEKSNLQVLCDACNHGKGNWDQTDWRGEDSPAVIERNTMTPRLVKKG